MVLFIMANFIFHPNHTSTHADTHTHLSNMWLYSWSLILYFILIHLINYTTAETWKKGTLKITNPPPHTHTSAECFCLVTHAFTHRASGTKTVCSHTSSLSSPPHLCLSSPLLPLCTSPSTHPDSKQPVIQQTALTTPCTPVYASVSVCARVCRCWELALLLQTCHKLCL